MNREMGASGDERSAAQLRAGHHAARPGGGDRCGEIGEGRMLEPEELLADLVAFFQPKVLQNRAVLITAGPTFEPIDPVRGLTNRSSGKMGFALARAAAEAGAVVTLVAGPVLLPTPRGVRRIDIGSAREMFDAVLPEAARSDVFIATAAVADWRPAALADEKIKKARGKAVPAFELVENPDILAAVAAIDASAQARRPFCVGFAAESHDLIRHAREKLERKRVPMIVANLGPATFGRDDNQLTLVDANGEQALPRADKLTLARQLVAEIAVRLARGR
jgi:phosphopantothenoylcysteine decarboxylase/phosphopantothenate--cysteine ligase